MYEQPIDLQTRLAAIVAYFQSPWISKRMGLELLDRVYHPGCIAEETWAQERANARVQWLPLVQVLLGLLIANSENGNRVP